MMYAVHHVMSALVAWDDYLRRLDDGNSERRASQAVTSNRQPNLLAHNFNAFREEALALLGVRRTLGSGVSKPAGAPCAVAGPTRVGAHTAARRSRRTRV